MQNNLSRLGGQLGVLLGVLGFVLMFLGWNGAASQAFVHQQFPYLISGGLIGLAVVVLGAAMLVVQNQRQDRAKLEAAIDRLVAATERHGSQAGVTAAGFGFTGFVVAGEASYHRVDCHLPEARDEAELVRIEDVVTRGLAACRVCNPPRLGQLTN